MARITMDADRFNSEASQAEYRGLESGDILYFPASPPLVSDVDRAFLVTQKQVDASYHKNISYRPLEDRLKGVDQDDSEQRRRVHAIMRDYSRRAIAFMSTLLEAVCGVLEDRLRQLPADRGVGPQGLAALAERPPAFRLVPDPALARRPAAADLHEHPPGTAARSGSPPITSRRSPDSSPTGSACIASRARWTLART